jgi:hypothetical protein
MKVTIVTEHNGTTRYTFEWLNTADIISFINNAIKIPANSMGIDIQVVPLAKDETKLQGDVGII